MATKPSAYATIELNPASTTSYNISDFTPTVLVNASEYEVFCETPHATLTAKSKTAFTVTISVQSPVVVNTAWLKFLRAVDPLVV